MSKKILTALAPVFAIAAFMVIPAIAQATQVQCGGAECAANTVITGSSTNLKTQLQSSGGTDEGTLECSSSGFEGELTANQVETATGSITKDTISGCELEGNSVTVHTNASVASPWTLQVQQPASGQVTGHIDPHSGGVIQFEIQGPFLDCDYSASSVQLMGTESSNVLTVEGTKQFQLQHAQGFLGGLCKAFGDLQGSLTTVRKSDSAAVKVDMS